MANSNKKNETPSSEAMLIAYEKLFSSERRTVHRFEPSGLRYVKLSGGAILVEQNPKKQSQWAKLARSGHKVAWVMRDGEYLGRVIDGDVEILKRKRKGRLD
jgi:hypothetical protein